MKMTRNEALILNQVLKDIRVSGMSVDARRKLIGLKIDLGGIAKVTDDFQSELIQAHKPSDFEKIQNDNTDEGKKAFALIASELDAKIVEVLNPYYAEDVSISYDGIKSDEFDKLTEVNDLTLAAYEFLNQKLV